MRSSQKKQIIESARKRERRGRVFLVAVILIIIAAGVGWYVWSSSLPSGTPDFMVAAPTGITIHAGSPATATINITAINNFDSTVHLTVTSSNGLTASINPNNVTGSGTATLRMSATRNGTYTVTVNATGGGLTHLVTPKVATPIYAKLVTSDGNLTIELYPAQAPKTVANFVNLADTHFYDNLVWHRIAKNPPVIQTGDPYTRYGNTTRSTWGTGGSSPTVPLEIDSSLHNNLGYLGMARGTDPNSGSSQFYINMANNNYLDGQYTVFGRVIGSMSAANAIANTAVNSSDQPINPVFLNTVLIY